jgi:MYXO-CTERM domain-containing protein
VSGNKEDQCESLIPADPATSGTLGTGGTVGITRTDASTGETDASAGGGGAMGPAALLVLVAGSLLSRRRAHAPMGS